MQAVITKPPDRHRTMTKTLTFIFSIFFISTFGQNDCESVSKSTIKKYENYSQDKFEKLKKSADTETLYNVAEFLRHKGDTTYKFWYINFIDITRAEFVPGKNITSADCILIFKVAKAYYYTRNFRHAQGLLNDLKISKCSDKCIDYYSQLVDKIIPK